MNNEEIGKTDPVDEAIIHAAKTGQGLIAINSAEELMQLAHAAKSTMDSFRKNVSPLVTQENALIIRQLRADGYTWRALARECHQFLGGNWTPESNQLAGMVLCETAAALLGEDVGTDPWN